MNLPRTCWCFRSCSTASSRRGGPVAVHVAACPACTGRLGRLASVGAAGAAVRRRQRGRRSPTARPSPGASAGPRSSPGSTPTASARERRPMNEHLDGPRPLPRRGASPPPRTMARLDAGGRSRPVGRRSTRAVASRWRTRAQSRPLVTELVVTVTRAARPADRPAPRRAVPRPCGDCRPRRPRCAAADVAAAVRSSCAPPGRASGRRWCPPATPSSVTMVFADAGACPCRRSGCHSASRTRRLLRPHRRRGQIALPALERGVYEVVLPGRRADVPPRPPRE